MSLKKIPPFDNTVRYDQLTHEQLVTLLREKAKQLTKMRFELNRVIEVNMMKDAVIARLKPMLEQLVDAL